MKIQWFEDTDVTSIKAFADIDNHHIDEVIVDEPNMMAYATLDYNKGPEKHVREYVIWNKENHKAYVIYNTEGSVKVDSPDGKKFQNYVFRQIDCLKDKLSEEIF